MKTIIPNVESSVTAGRLKMPIRNRVTFVAWRGMGAYVLAACLGDQTIEAELDRSDAGTTFFRLLVR